MSTNINSVVLTGRLTRDAELKYITSGTAVCKFSIAVNRRVKKADSWIEEANFFDVVLWGKTAEALNQYLIKGKEIAVNGELRQSRWEKDGQQRSRVEVTATNIQLLGGIKSTDTSKTEKKSFETFTKENYSNDFEDSIPC